MIKIEFIKKYHYSSSGAILLMYCKISKDSSLPLFRERKDSVCKTNVN